MATYNEPKLAEEDIYATHIQETATQSQIANHSVSVNDEAQTRAVTVVSFQLQNSYLSTQRHLENAFQCKRKGNNHFGGCFEYHSISLGLCQKRKHFKPV